MIIDLHTHTNKSDGDYSPSELMELAKQSNIELISITDHDTIEGLEEGEKAAESEGIEFIPGIEISTKAVGELHILGYNIDRKSKGLIEACDEFMRLRLEREARILKYLHGKGLDISKKDVDRQTTGQYIGRPHIAKAMIQKGYVKDVKEAFTRYLATKEFQNIERPKPSTDAGIRVINEAGGCAVLAHPHTMRLGDDELLKELKRLKIQGLAGIECYYKAYSRRESEKYRNMAIKLGLIVTGGSDFHGEKSKPGVFLGVCGDKIEHRKLMNCS